MDAFVKKFFIKEATACMWTGQAVENFHNPRSRWSGSSTLINRLNRRGVSKYVLVDSFDWGRAPQGHGYWAIKNSESLV